jgi:phosphate transport system substrate-binding protein
MHNPRRSAWWQPFRRPALILGVLALALSLALVACSDDDDDEDNGDASGTPALSGAINGDGSSTVFPITEAVAEEFGKVHDVDVTVGISGTGGGFEKFCAGETDFSNASRPIEDDEIAACDANDIEFVEFEVAYDGLSNVVNPNNDFVDCLTVEQLNAIWAPESTVNNWNQVDPSFPDQDLTLYGAGTDSGTFDYFTDEINGEEGASRADYTASEDDNVLVQGVAGDENALGYFGFAYYVENDDKLKVLAVDNGAGCVTPSQDTIESGEYAPLSRPLYVYVTTDALARPEVAEFMRFYMTEGPDLAVEVGYVASPQASYDAGLAQIP